MMTRTRRREETVSRGLVNQSIREEERYEIVDEAVNEADEIVLCRL